KGLNRFLLSMLDGLEAETAGKVAVILTAMDPNQLPAALLRSGRVELWLETRLPDAAVRREILGSHIAKLPAALQSYDFERVSDATAGFNAADLARLVADVKALYARDILRKRPVSSVDDYLAHAVDEVRKTKALIASAEQGTLATTESQRDYYGAAGQSGKASK